MGLSNVFFIVKKMISFWGEVSTGLFRVPKRGFQNECLMTKLSFFISLMFF